ncbi:hypothetical protein V2A60_006350 [Cordyceps javanica]|uniref:Uncharacterized protein n=1 Tax=Cordyceps javanica TaxID=43265 RepID=A0A545V8K5_9HYPO|nr:hypothetical protein IF1G_03682 [Cordyceps javanica]TQW08880.1 hypothetical protein IF2G_03311 [Cordyceps javanica]
MHVLNGFSTRRKTRKPRDLHIRKVSFSGCSLSSGCSIDSASSTSTARGPGHHRSDSDASYDPLRLHPIVQPPPRLHERAYIASPKRRENDSPRTLFDGRDAGSDGQWSGYGVSVFEYDDSDTEVDEDEDGTMEQAHNTDMPPMATPIDHEADESDDEDYFFMQLSKRPQLPRSHWSESTIQTLAQLTPAASNIATPAERLEDPIEQARMMLPNFSWKHNTIPARPRMRAMDSVEHLTKLGGWKRKAVALDNQENIAPADGN